jgi:hypothetical protein
LSHAQSTAKFPQSHTAQSPSPALAV